MTKETQPHVLFVDDEPRMLSGLRRMLVGQREHWRMSFANSAHKALDVLSADSCDVIVTDYRMPEMDGGELLRLVREQYPSTARVIFSGQTDESSLLNVVLLAHRLLSKPCQAEEIISAIERVLALRAVLSDENIKREIVGLESLPSPPTTLIELFQVLESENASVAAVASVIERDPAATAKVLQVVNSVSSGMKIRVTDLRQAISLLGMRNVRALVLMHDLIGTFDTQKLVSPEWASQLTRHCIQTSRLARRLAGDAPWADHAFIAGLLLEVGQLVLASCRPDAFTACLDAWHESEGSLSDAELAILNINHARIGAYLLHLWGLPLDVVEAVASHGMPVETLCPTDVASTVALAHALVEDLFGPICGDAYRGQNAVKAQTDPETLRRIAVWRRKCAENTDPT